MYSSSVRVTVPHALTPGALQPAPPLPERRISKCEGPPSRAAPFAPTPSRVGYPALRAAGRDAAAWPGVAASASRCAAPPSISNRGSHSSHFGRYQFQSPSRCIVAGSSTARTSVALEQDGGREAEAELLHVHRRQGGEIANTATITTAAEVTTPAVWWMPPATASSVLAPRSTSSLTRLRMNTW